MLPAYVYLPPNKIAVTQTADIYNVGLPQGTTQYTWGYIQQLGRTGSIYNYVGDRILFKRPNPIESPVVIIEGTPFNLIGENDIELTEPISPPL